MSLKEFVPFLGLLIFGNIENLVLASQGVVFGVNSFILGILSLIFVISWLLIGTLSTKIAIKYEKYISFIGGLAIFILGLQSMLEALNII